MIDTLQVLRDRYHTGASQEPDTQQEMEARYAPDL